MASNRRRLTVVVAGLGAIGSSVAYHLARRGVGVLGLDLHEPPHDFGSSHGESRIIREAYFEHPSYVPLVRRAYASWSELERTSGTRLLTATGALVLGPPESVAVRGAEASAREHGISHRVLSSTAIRSEFPELRPRTGEVGVHEERAGVLAPGECISAFLRGAAAASGDLRYGEPLGEWESGSAGGVKVTTAKGRYEADALVIAAGPWIPGLVAGLRLQIERQVMVWFAPRDRSRSFAPERFPIFLWEDEHGVFYGVPDLGRGIKAARHHGGATFSGVAEVPQQVHPADIEPVRRFLAERVPNAAGGVTGASVCRYTNTSDGHFLLDRHPDHSNVWIATACSGHGFKFTSALGEALAEEIITDRRDPELEMFRWRTAV